MIKLILLGALIVAGQVAVAQKIPIPPMPKGYPRMTDPSAVSSRGRGAADRWVNAPEELEGRLQMYWDSHATQIYIGGEEFGRAGGPPAPVPTVRYPGNRSGITNYQRPPLEQIRLHQDSLGVWMKNKGTGQYEWVDPAKTGTAMDAINVEILRIARDAAAVYACEGDEAYARLAAKVFDTYMTGLYYRDVPVDTLHTHQQTLVGLTSFEVIHETAVNPATECYDLLHDYLCAGYADKIPIYEDTFRKWADVIIAGGVPQNNWNLLQAQYVLRIAAVIQDNEAYADGRGREWYLNRILNEDSIRQWSIGKLIDYGFDPVTGLWRECPNYSCMVVEEFSNFIRITRRLTGINLPEYYPILGKAVTALPQYLFPNGLIAAWGDGGYTPLRRNLFIPLQEPLSGYTTPVFYSEAVSWFASRSGDDPHNSLMFSVAGSEGNHMHANGISLELYGKGYVLAPDMGKGTGYGTLDHNEYYAQFPAHNTVCVDGVSSYATMESHHAFKLESCYPEPMDKSAPKGISFGDFSFIEPETAALQRRQVVMITNDAGGYYIDIFRSRRQDGKDDFHDYFFHGLGQEFELDVDGLEPTQELAFAGAHLYGYSYLWDKYSATTDKDVHGRFIMKSSDGSETGLNMWMAGSPERDVFKALSPAVRSCDRARIPYDVGHSPCRTFVARQHGEAWDRPFVAVYEPYCSDDACFVGQVDFENDKKCMTVTVKRKDGRTDVVKSYSDGRLVVRSCGRSVRNRK